MIARVHPAPLQGAVRQVSPSKSLAQRALICAALADGPTLVRNMGQAEDVRATMRCLAALSARFERVGDDLRVWPLGTVSRGAQLDCGESGATLRFLLPLAAALGADCCLTGQGRLAARPLSPLYEQLCAHGARLSPQGRFPLACTGQLQAGEYRLAGDVSSQFVSGLLLALPLLTGDSRVVLTSPLQSKPYVDMTRDMLARFGVRVEETATGYAVPGGQQFHTPVELTVEGDWSGAAFWLVAGALGSAGVTCAPLRVDSLQGDRAILTLLSRFGACVRVEGDSAAIQPGPLRGIAVEAADIPDLVPVLAVMAGAAQGETRITSIRRLRYKESNRVESILRLLNALGVQAKAEDDCLTVKGRGGFAGGKVDACGDHRIAMAAAVAGSAAAGPVTILGAEAVRKSYPNFFDQFAALGGQVEVFDAL